MMKLLAILVGLAVANAAEKTTRYYAKIVPDNDDFVTASMSELYSEYDGSGEAGLSGVVGDYFLWVVTYNFPNAGGNTDVNDNKMTFVLNDDKKSTLVFGSIFYAATAAFPLNWPVWGGNGAFKGVTNTVTVDTDGQVVIFDVKIKGDEGGEGDGNDSDSDSGDSNGDDDSGAHLASKASLILASIWCLSAYLSM